MSDHPSHPRPSERPPHTAEDAIPHIPKQLLDELHQANEKLAESGHEREVAMDSSIDSDTPRDAAREHVTAAEKQVEAVTEKIDKILKTPPAPTNSPAQSDRSS